MNANSVTRLLLVEDSPGDARLLREMLADASFQTTRLVHATCLKEAEDHLAGQAVDIVLLDLGLPDAVGLSAIQRVHSSAPRVPVVVLTGSDDDALALQALQQGAQDYLVKGQIDGRALHRALRYAIERKTLDEALFVERERAQVTLDSIGDAVICTDISGAVSFLNVMAQTMTGWSWHEAAGQPIAKVLRIVDADTREPTPSLMEQAIRPDRIVHLPSNYVLIRRDGLEIPVEDSVAAIHDREGRVAGTVVVFRDVSLMRALVLQTAHSAEHDFLTGLPNRMLLHDRVNQAIALAHRHHQSVAVLFLDLDGFKHINDSRGHLTGDKLLQSIAKRLVDSIRGSDTASRQGGDEFVVLLSEVKHAEDASISARRILHAVAEPHIIDAHRLHVTTSIGVSVYPEDGVDAETLIKNADTAMYQAKEYGRQGYQFFDASMNVRAVERQSLREDCGAPGKAGVLPCATSPKSICGPASLPARKP